MKNLRGFSPESVKKQQVIEGVVEVMRSRQHISPLLLPSLRVLWLVQPMLCSTRPQVARKEGIGFPSITSWLLNPEIRQDENRVKSA